ncbi:GH32 C-terminal domain-containing protein [Opitutus sp. ER46]|uniref:glycoside hydrolase family 32 protein n=1 Tax=Opitutus sp. ER46 TaxID=2161864 RepID=UPI000D3091FF|nr:GH32 C-terminal domain-containing protein [Opitutus sp. ER46]PTX95708.1 hypothetical protein DB354_09860 [Opitutus sp. ER46]
MIPLRPSVVSVAAGALLAVIAVTSQSTLAAEATPPDHSEGAALPARTRWTATGSALNASLRPPNADLPATVWADSRVATNGTGATGTLTSPPFSLTQPCLVFQITGGAHPFRAAFNLLCDGQVVRTATGGGTTPRTVTWDVRRWLGRKGQLQVVDLVDGDDGFVRVEALSWAETPATAPSGDVPMAVQSARQEAQADVAAARRRAGEDPWRPQYHFLPPAQRMNDPNGPFWADGWYHLFYQWNVFADRPGAGAMTWGQARSRDLVRWEHLPIALWPDWERGEAQCYSGGAFQPRGGAPLLFYASVPATAGMRSQWRVAPRDAAFTRWERDPSQAVVAADRQDGPAQHAAWRDPFVFETGGRTFMLLAAEHVPIYEATDAALTHWTYRGVFYDRPGLSAECPNLFPIGDRWILLLSPKGPVEYWVGRFDPETARFTVEREGRLHQGKAFYATHGLRDGQGRQILLGLVKGFPSGRGWRDCLALPRVLTLGADLRPRLEPVPELAQLRGEAKTVANLTVANTTRAIPGVTGDRLELIADLELGDARACGLRVRTASNGSRGVELRYVPGELRLPGSTVRLAPSNSGRVRLHVFLDRGVIEVFADEGRIAEVAVVRPDPADLTLTFFAEGGTAVLRRLDAWTLAALPETDVPWETTAP